MTANRAVVLAVDGAGPHMTLSWGAPTPSEGQPLARLWRPDRTLDP